MAAGAGGRAAALPPKAHPGAEASEAGSRDRKDMTLDLIHEMQATGHIPWSPEKQRRLELKEDERAATAIVKDICSDPCRVFEAEAWCSMASTGSAINCLVTAFAKVGQLQRALHWAEELRESGSELQEGAIYPFLYECGRQGNFAVAETLLTQQVCLQRPQILGAFLVGSMERLHLANARQWLSRMEELSDQIGGASDLNFLEGVAKAAQPDLAKSWLNYMRRSGVEPQREHYDALILACRDDFGEAKRWFQRLMDDGFTPEVSSYTALLQAATSADAAADLLQRMSDDFLVPSARSYSAAVQAAARSQNVKLAVEWLKLSQDGRASPEASYNAALGALARAKRWHRVEELLEEMKGVVEPSVVTYNNMLAICARSGDEKGVEFWLERMKAEGHSLDLVAFNTLVDFHARQGRVDAALQWIERLKAAGWSPGVLSYSPVVLAMARKGDTKSAAMCLRTMMADEVMPNAVAFSAVLQSFVAQGDVAGADSLLSRLVAQDVALDPRTFQMIIPLCNRQGAHHLACKWFQHALQLGSMTSACASAALASLAAVGDAAETAVLLQQFEDDGLTMKVRAYASLVKAWAAKGRIVLAVYMIGKMYAAGHQCTPLTWATLLEACRSKPRRSGEAELLLRCMAEHRAPIPGTRAMSALLWTFGQIRLERLLRKLGLKVGPAPSAQEEDKEACWCELQRCALLPAEEFHTPRLKRVWSPRIAGPGDFSASHYRLRK